MKHKIGFFAFFATLAGSLCLSPAFAVTYSGGSGTAEDPFNISTVADWWELAEDPNDWDKYFVLTADLDFDGESPPLATDMDNSEWSGFQGTPFTGVFDGQRHTLYHLSVNEPNRDYIGLFGYVGAGGQILNLGVEDVYIVGRGYIGGIVGWNEGTIRGCHATGTVIGVGNSYDVGGLCGENREGTISQCYTMATVEGYWTVGGLAGANYDGTITSCFAAGYTYGAGSTTGGLVGWNYGPIISCYSTGIIYGNEYGGGLVGQNTCEGTIYSSYTTGTVIPISPDSVVGGLVGYSLGFILSSFWDTEISGQTGSFGGEGKTTAEMKTLSTYTDADWDFTDTWWMPNDSYPRLMWEKGYSGGSGTAEDPYRISTIADWQELMAGSVDWDKQFVLLNDIDFGGMNLTPVARDTDPSAGGFQGTLFSGVIDGNGHVLRNATLNLPDSDYVGLFGWLGSDGQIRNLGVENVNTTGNTFVGSLCGVNEGMISYCYANACVTGEHSVGGLCGWNNTGKINYCYATGTVSGSSDVGGLCGMSGGGTINNCYATGIVSGTSTVGGLCGDNYGTISNCYSTGTVSGNQFVGGLCGWNDGGTISNCYAAGAVSGTGSIAGGLCGLNETTVSNCFWDTQTTGQSSGSRGDTDGMTGKTTAEMQTLSTFTDASWDFVGESTNGTNDTWRMCTNGVDYPRLSWEFAKAGDFDCPDGVALDDLLYLAARWLAATPEIIGASDANSDGKVDLSDLAILAAHWLVQ
jgi:hypothetical protein